MRLEGIHLPSADPYGLGGLLSLRSFRAVRPGGRLVVFGAYSTLVNGRKSRRAWIEWYAATAGVALRGLLSPRRRVFPYRIQKLRDGRPLTDARRAHEMLESSAARENSCSGP